MPRGGRRPGAGRKFGSVTKRTRKAADEAAEGGILPLTYMLQIMRDPSVESHRRDRMAELAAPFVHAKLAAVAVHNTGNAPQSDMLVTQINFVSIPPGCDFNGQPFGDLSQPRIAPPFAGSAVEIEEIVEAEVIEEPADPDFMD